MAEHTGRTIDDCIDVLFSDIDFDSLEIWAKALEVDVEYPTDDMWPDWEAELSVKTGEALLRAVRFNIHTDICPTCKDKQQRDELREVCKEMIEDRDLVEQDEGFFACQCMAEADDIVKPYLPCSYCKAKQALSINQPAQEKVEK